MVLLNVTNIWKSIKKEDKYNNERQARRIMLYNINWLEFPNLTIEPSS